MEVCRKLDNIKLENRPYTEVSSGDIEARLGLSSEGKYVFAKALTQDNPSSCKVIFIAARIVENIR